LDTEDDIISMASAEKISILGEVRS